MSATLTDPGYTGSATGTLNIIPAPQAIAFAPPASMPYSSTPITLKASSDAGLPVTLTLLSGPAELSGFTLTTTYQASAWRTQYFTPTELADPAISGPQADPDGDGFVNLIEFAMNLDPETDDRHRNLGVYQTVTDQGQTYPAMTIRRRHSYPGLTALVEATVDLGSWGTPATAAHGPAIDNGDGTETVTYRSVLPISGSSLQFLRVRVLSP